VNIAVAPPFRLLSLPLLPLLDTPCACARLFDFHIDIPLTLLDNNQLASNSNETK